MGEVLYLDATFGLSGDMLLAALSYRIDLAEVIARLKTLPLEPWQAEVTEVTRCGIRARQVVFTGSGGSGLRHLSQIQELFRASDWPPEVTRLASTVFSILAEAEAEVHGVSPEKVHFHEVGALDSILDIAGFAWAYHLAGQPPVFVSTLPFTEGTVRTEHGLMPVPAPATTRLLQGYRLRQGDVPTGEAITPTGAAILVGLAAKQGWPDGQLISIGYGAGQRDPENYPNVLRALWLEQDNQAEADEVVLIEATIDDLDPRLYPVVMDKLFNAGALDVAVAPVVMKKGRPGQLLRVLVRPTDLLTAAGIIFAETTTIGLSYTTRRRITLPRSVITVTIGDIPVRVKLAQLPEGSLNVSPEYADCLAAAATLGRSVKEIMLEASSLALQRRE